MSAPDLASGQPEISAIVLCYRAEEQVVPVLERLQQALVKVGAAFELVLVANYDRGVEDKTPDVARAYAAGRDDVVPVVRPKEGAMGWDLRSGLEAARGRYLIVLDGDGQNPPENVAELYGLMKAHGAHVGKGRRTSRSDGVYRRLISFFYNMLFRVMFRLSDIWDVNGKPKGLTREAYDRMTLTSDDWFIDAELVLEAARLKLPIVELPVVFLENPERASFVRPQAILEFIGNMLLYRLRRWRT